MEQNAIYIVFSSTPYWMGKMIRRVTGGKLNHVSIALDSELNQQYSFARLYAPYPLLGGFVKEEKCRFHLKGKASDIIICRLPVTPESRSKITSCIRKMEKEKEEYLYNFLSAMAALRKRTVPVEKSYTCEEFAIHILAMAGYPFTEGHYYGVDSLAAQLKSYIIYEGAMPQGERIEEFYCPKGISHPHICAIRRFLALYPRKIKKNPHRH